MFLLKSVCSIPRLWKCWSTSYSRK